MDHQRRHHRRARRRQRADPAGARLQPDRHAGRQLPHDLAVGVAHDVPLQPEDLRLAQRPRRVLDRPPRQLDGRGESGTPRPTWRAIRSRTSAPSKAGIRRSTSRPSAAATRSGTVPSSRMRSTAATATAWATAIRRSGPSRARSRPAGGIFGTSASSPASTARRAAIPRRSSAAWTSSAEPTRFFHGDGCFPIEDRRRGALHPGPRAGREQRQDHRAHQRHRDLDGQRHRAPSSRVRRSSVARSASMADSTGATTMYGAFVTGAGIGLRVTNGANAQLEVNGSIFVGNGIGVELTGTELTAVRSPQNDPMDTTGNIFGCKHQRRPRDRRQRAHRSGTDVELDQLSATSTTSRPRRARRLHRRRRHLRRQRPLGEHHARLRRLDGVHGAERLPRRSVVSRGPHQGHQGRPLPCQSAHPTAASRCVGFPCPIHSGPIL